MSSNPADRIRLVVTDIDGTLVDKEKRLSPRAIEAAAALRRAGVKLALVSSRPAAGMRMFLDPLEIDTPHAGFNGGEIVSPEGRILESLYVPDPFGRLALDMMQANGVDPWVFADGKWFITNPAAPYVPLEHRTVKMEPTVVSDFDDMVERAGKIMGASSDFHLLERVETEMLSSFGPAVAAHRSQNYYLDVTHPQARKDHALRALARLLGVSMDQTAALGDMPNDSEMLRAAGLSVAMGNAPDEVQEVAHFVTADNEHDGWAEAIETLILPRAGGTH